MVIQSTLFKVDGEFSVTILLTLINISEVTGEKCQGEG